VYLKENDQCLPITWLFLIEDAKLHVKEHLEKSRNRAICVF
jgi:hypothetical protein